MKPVDGTPLPTLCCEMNPLMAESGKRVYDKDDPDTYLELVPLECHFCKNQVCEECWKSGKHFIKNFVVSVLRDSFGSELWTPMKVVRDIPACIDPWKNMLLKVKAEL